MNERECWQHLCDVFEQLTGESMDDAASPKEYKAFASLCKIWAEHFADTKIKNPSFVSIQQLPAAVLEAWDAMDTFLDKIAREKWTDDHRTLKIVEPDTEKYVAVTVAVGEWGKAMSDVRLAQGEDGVRWGRNVIQFESAKVKKLRR